jgi:hypothetical protein
LLLPNIDSTIFFIPFDGLGNCTPKDKRILIIIENIIKEKYKNILPLFFSFKRGIDSKNITMIYEIIIKKNIYKSPLIILLWL